MQNIFNMLNIISLCTISSAGIFFLPFFTRFEVTEGPLNIFFCITFQQRAVQV